MHQQVKATATATLLLAVWLAPGLLPAVETTEADAPVVSSAADRLMAMARFLSQQKQFTVVQNSGYDVVQDSGQKLEFGERRELVFARPDRFKIDVQRNDGEAQTVTFDGRTVTVVNSTRKMHASSEIPGTVDAAILHFVKDLEMRLPLAMLFVTSLPEEIESRVGEVETVETLMLDDVPFVHLAARADTVDFQVWLPTTGDPLPRRIVITYKYEEGQPQYWADFSNWNLSPDLEQTAFSPDIPEDSSRIPFRTEITAKHNSARQQENQDER